MNLMALFRRERSAPVARERLQVLLAHERMAGSHSDLLNLLREEIVDVIARHIKVDRDKVNIKLDRGDQVSTLEIDVEMPSAIPLVKTQSAAA
jgi:cell division topological specificity factor